MVFGGWCDYGADIRTLQQKGADICVIGDRLKEERERLGLTQPAFAEIAGAKKRTLIDWEKGVSSPTAVQLSALAAEGVDVLYILTGQRSTTAAPAAQPISSDDRRLLSDFHAAPAQVQSGIKTALGAFTPGAGTHSKRGKAA